MQQERIWSIDRQNTLCHCSTICVVVDWISMLVCRLSMCLKKLDFMVYRFEDLICDSLNWCWLMICWFLICWFLECCSRIGTIGSCCIFRSNFINSKSDLHWIWIWIDLNFTLLFSKELIMILLSSNANTRLRARGLNFEYTDLSNLDLSGEKKKDRN